MIKHRLAALFFRCLFLGVFVYAIYQTLMDAIVLDRDWLHEILQFPNYFIILTILIQLYLVIKGILQIKKQGMPGMTKLSPHIRGGFALTGILLILVYRLVFVPSSVNPSASILSVIRFDLCGLFWLLDWLLFDERNLTKPWSPFLWLFGQVYLYLGIIFVRASNTLQHPYIYDILNINRYGIAGVGKNIAVITFIYLVMGYVMYLVDQVGKKKDNVI